MNLLYRDINNQTNITELEIKALLIKGLLY